MKREFEDTKGVIRIRKFRGGQKTKWPKEKWKRTNNDLQNTTKKTKHQATRTH